MPGKKKKFNSRFPPARIKKIMQTDEEVGKVAAAVPVIISRGLELFVKSLLTRAGEITTARHARTLTPAHLKQCIMADKRFDFLQELVASVADITGDGESDAGPPTPSTPLTPVINFPLQGSALHPMLSPPPASPSPSLHAPHDNTTPLTIPVSAGDSWAEVKSPRGRGRGRSRGRGRGRGQAQGPPTTAASGGRGERRPRGRPRKVIQPLHAIEEPDSDDGLSLNVDTDQEEQDSDTEEEEEEEEITPMDYSSNSQRTKPSIASPGVSHPEAPCNVRFTEGTPKVAGLQISVGGGLSLGLPSETGNKGTSSPSTALPSFKIGQSPTATTPSPSTALPSFKIGQSPAATPSPSTALPSFKIGQSPAASPSPSTALPSFKIGQSPATSPSPSTTLPSFKIGQSPTASPPLVHPSATITSPLGIHITIPGLPTSCAIVPGGGTPPVTISPVRLPNTPVTPGVKPSFGVPVPVITSVQSVQNRPQLSIAYAPSATSLHSQHSANNDVDEDYDS